MTKAALQAHLAGGATTLCRAWIVTRRDGKTLGFTDHDRDIVLAGVICRADSGLTAQALQQTTGLSVDNTEARGALTSASITEADVQAGRFDGADVEIHLVNWAAPEQRLLEFRGFLGEITRSGGAFRAELRGLTERLNQPQGHAFQAGCSAILGDRRCGFDTSAPGFFAEDTLSAASDGQIFHLAGLAGFADRWFENGRFEILTGAGKGLIGVVKIDRIEADSRRIELWETIIADLGPGDRVRIVAGCDKSATTCRVKFANFPNFRGFPHIPSEDWLSSYPIRDRANTGRSRYAR
jgi:uncharacterized phage protein (TIGR02218 family)